MQVAECLKVSTSADVPKMTSPLVRELSMKNGPVRVGIIGSQFQAENYASAISMIAGDMSLIAVTSPTAGHAQALANRHNISRVYTDYRDLAADPEIEAVTISSLFIDIPSLGD